MIHGSAFLGEVPVSTRHNTGVGYGPGALKKIQTRRERGYLLSCLTRRLAAGSRVLAVVFGEEARRCSRTRKKKVNRCCFLFFFCSNSFGLYGGLVNVKLGL